MKTIRLTGCITILLLTIQTICIGQQIYLSPKGNDSNPGTKEKPLATLTGARDLAREIKRTNSSGSIEIVILEGEYFMDSPLILTPDDSPSSSYPLIFKAEEGNKVIFRGGMKISGFQKVNENLWKVFIPEVSKYGWYFEQLYVNDRRAIRAKTPNEGIYFVKQVLETVAEMGTGRSPDVAIQKVVFDSTSAACFEGFTGQDYEDALIVFYHSWDNTRKRILNFNKKQSCIYIAGEGMKPWNPINNKSRWFAENYRAALDSPGEWFLDRTGYLYYIPCEGEKLETTTFFAPLTSEFIRIEGQSSDKPVSNIKFENLNFRIAGYRTPQTGNEAAQAAAPVGAVITLDFATKIEFRNCEIAHTGTYGFWFRRGCYNCTVNQCFMHDLGAGGIKLGELTIRPEVREITNNIIIDNNIITDGGHIFPCAVGIIIFNASDNKLTHNEISNLRYSGISVGWVWGYSPSPSKRNIIQFNHIHHLGWGELCDMGGVYTLGASEGTVVSNNLIHHVYSFDYGGWGLYTDEGSYGIIMEKNLVYSCKNSGFHQHYGKENIIKNNIFALNIRAQLQATRIEEHRSFTFTNNIIYYDKGTLLANNWKKINIITDNNCYWDKRTKDILYDKQTFAEWQKSGKDIHSIIADPLFVNPSAYDFHFKNMSVVKKIKFIPFDYSQAGVYGSDEWERLAEIDPVLSGKFDSMVNLLENK
jgi:hypothetical protein